MLHVEHGSAQLVRYLLRHDLLDELKLAVFPVVAGTSAGARLFDGIDQPRRLQLVDLRRTGTGVLVLTYRPDRA
jgi:dihydrofolate reductase